LTVEDTMASELDKKINTFAIRSFRDVADRDYIAARLVFRADLMPQFLWAGQQAVEKYLKAILCFYRIPAANISHNLAKALDLTARLPFQMELSDESVEMINHLGALGPRRYLETAWFVEGYVLPRFDRAVWEVRRYCQAVDHEALNPDGSDPRVLRSIETSRTGAPHTFEISGGFLEHVRRTREHPNRPGLLWQNGFFASRLRKAVRAQRKLSAANPPLMLNPEILDDVKPLVYIPRDVEHVCRTVWQAKARADSRIPE
jgi:HEPN domain-containing protein